MGAGLSYMTAPPEPFVPEEARGKPAGGIVCCYAGDPADGEEAMRPLREGIPPAMDMVEPMPYLRVQGLIEQGNPPGLRNYWNADFLAECPDSAIETLVEYSQRVPSPLTSTLLIPGGGAISRVDDDAMAFGQRRAPWNLHILSMWADPAHDDLNVSWTRNFGRAMKRHTTGRAYLNFIGDEGQERVRAAFGPEKYERLVRVKDEYDPENVFRLNQNIPPSAVPAG